MAFNRSSWWPDVSDLHKAERAIRYGFWAAIFAASATAIAALMSLHNHKPILGVDRSGLFDALVFAAIAYGIHRKSRAAAIIGLGLYAAYLAYLLFAGSATEIVMVLILTLCFVHSVRGTFAYRKLTTQSAMAGADVT